MNPMLGYPPTLMVVAASIFSAVVVTACGPVEGDPAVAAAQAASGSTAPGAAMRQWPAPGSHLGRVRGIDPVTEELRPTGAGALSGAAAGGVIGHPLGDGKTAATAPGALGGAVAGHRIERARAAAKVVGYDVHVRLDNGEVRTIRLESLDGLGVGDRIDTGGGRLRRI